MATPLPPMPPMPPPPPRPKLAPEAISIRMTAQLLDVSELTVRRWIRRGFIMAYRVGPFLIRIPRSEIVRMRSVRLAYTRYGDQVDYPTV